MDKTKPFGLIISKRSQSFRPSTKAVFGSDSDDEPARKKMTNIPQAKLKQPPPELCEDPSIYEYDSIYDDMKAQEVAKVAPKDTSKPSRYIGSLLKAADKRKKDQERRVEKKVHVEREKEGDKFKDKEAFVTSSYKKKMQEMEEDEERERRENMLNEMMDVTKQKDLSGFYRHFLKQSVGEEKVPVFGERYSKTEAMQDDDGANEIAIKREKLSDEEGVPDRNIDRDSDIDVDSSSDGEDAKDEKRNSGEKVLNKVKRNYRRTDARSEKGSVPDEDSDASSSDGGIQRGTLDDVSQEKSSEKELKTSDLESQKSSRRGVEETKGSHSRKRDRSPDKSGRNIRKKTGSEEPGSDDDEDSDPGSNAIDGDAKISTADEKVVDKRSREDIFKKRTVGEVFAAAQARYFQRMALRSA